MKKKKNRKTLKKRIRRILFFCFFSTIIVLGALYYVFVFNTLKATSNIVSNYLGNSLAYDLGSPNLLGQLNIESWEDFDETSPYVQEWTRKMDLITRANNTVFEENLEINSTLDVDLFIIHIEINDKVIYSNVERNLNYDIINRNAIFSTLHQKFLFDVTYNIHDNYNNIIGTVTIHTNSLVTILLFGGIGFIFLIIILVVLIIARLLSTLFAMPILQPINQFEKVLKAAAMEDNTSVIDKGIVLKKPFREFESLSDAINLIIGKMLKYSSILKLQKQELENQFNELEAQNEELIDSQTRIQEAQNQIIQKEKEVRLLLDNAGQGFMTCGKNLIVDQEYSAECLKIFSKLIENRKIGDLLYSDDLEQRNFIEALMLKLLEEKDPKKQEVYSSLLPNEVLINGRHIQLEYKVVHDEEVPKFMIILTDISDKRQLEQQMNQEKKILKMVVKVVTDREVFLSCIKDYQDFCTNILSSTLERSKNAEDTLYYIFRNIHTFKGNFSQLEMISIVQHLHDMESVLGGLKKEGSFINIDKIKHYIDECPLLSWLEQDIDVLKQFLDESFFVEQDAIVIDREQVKEIERRMLKLLPSSDYNLILPDIKKLRYQPFYTIVQPYIDFVSKLSERMEKPVYPLKIEGGKMLVDTEMYRGFSKSLVHIFRNIFVHGIESAEERIEKSKDEYGTIKCTICTDSNYIKMSISDDGRGIDLQKIRQKAIEKGFFTEEELKKMNEKAILDLIFKDEFSTKENVDVLSGRGIGLSAVLHTVKELGGKAEVYTEKNTGTEFVFYFPMEIIIEDRSISMQEIMLPALKTANSFIQNTLNADVLNSDYKIEQLKKLVLNEYTAFIELKGAFNGWFILSFDKKLSMQLVQKFSIDELTSEEQIEYLEDVLSECTNTIIGNSLGDIENIGENIHIESPIIIFSSEASLRCLQNEIFSSDLVFDQGNIILAFIASKLL